MGRALTTGRYETREELEYMVWDQWTNTPRNQTQIAKCCQVSQATVATILKEERKCQPPQM